MAIQAAIKKIVDYAKTRPVFDGYKAARYSKKYLAEHEAALATYRAARAAMNDILAGLCCRMNMSRT